jgi:hypothetical protein
MNKRVASTAVASAVGASLVFGLAACGKDTPPSDFKKACDRVNGKTMRENDFESLGMAPMAFVAGKGKGGSKSSSKRSGGFGSLFGGKSKPKSKSPKTTKKNNGWKLAGGNGHTKPKNSKKSKSHDDNEWVCAKNGVEIFDED